MKLAGATALVTGASNGIGAGTARVMASRGTRVALVARDQNALAVVADGIGSRGGDTAVFSADLTDIDRVAALEREVTSRLGTPDVIVNCAGAGPLSFRRGDERGGLRGTDGRTLLCGVFREPGIHRGDDRAGQRPGGQRQLPGIAGRMPRRDRIRRARRALRGFSEALRTDLASTGVGVTEAVIGKVSSSYWAKNTSTEARVPSIANLAAPLQPDQAGAAVVRGVESDASLVTAPWTARLVVLQARLASRATTQLMIHTGARRRTERKD
jgi:short-subunit dehydrogenase